MTPARYAEWGTGEEGRPTVHALRMYWWLWIILGSALLLVLVVIAPLDKATKKSLILALFIVMLAAAFFRDKFPPPDRRWERCEIAGPDAVPGNVEIRHEGVLLGEDEGALFRRGGLLCFVGRDVAFSVPSKSLKGARFEYPGPLGEYTAVFRPVEYEPDLFAPERADLSAVAVLPPTTLSPRRMPWWREHSGRWTSALFATIVTWMLSRSNPSWIEPFRIPPWVVLAVLSWGLANWLLAMVRTARIRAKVRRT